MYKLVTIDLAATQLRKFDYFYALFLLLLGNKGHIWYVLFNDTVSKYRKK